MPDLTDLVSASQQARQNKKIQVEKDNERQDFESQLDKLELNRESTLRGFRLLIEYLEGKTTKTEVVNQIDSVKTPDIEAVVNAVQELKTVTENKDIDLNPLTEAIQTLGSQIDTLPKEFPQIPEPQKALEVTNLQAVESSLENIGNLISKLNLVAEAPIINIPKAPKPEVNVAVDNESVVNAIEGLSLKVEALTLAQANTPVLPWEQMEQWLSKLSDQLEWIGSRPVSMSGGGTTTTTTVEDTTDNLLLENGDALLLENGDQLLLESS